MRCAPLRAVLWLGREVGCAWATQVEWQERWLLLNRPWEQEFLHWSREGEEWVLHGSRVPPAGRRRLGVTRHGWCPRGCHHDNAHPAAPAP